MDSIVTTAIVGTGQAGAQEITTGTPVDALTQQLAVDTERRLLLAAGAWSTYRAAGYPAALSPAAPSPAKTEILEACSAKAARLLSDLLAGKRKEVLHEALVRLQQCERRLPYELLPQALAVGRTMKELRPVLAAVVGERGRWLSSFNPEWSWVAQLQGGAEQDLPEDAETIWQEGTTEQRREILERLRVVDPAKAREWLMAVWKQEKADVKVELLAVLETGISTDDEPLLEKALDDRSENVRIASANLLALIPTSAFRQRMVERADAMLMYTYGAFTAQIPERLEKAWQRDGISARVLHRISEQSWWLLQVLSFIPPAHWEERFAADPATLIASLDVGELQTVLIEGWSNAALLHDEKRWLSPLWKWWSQQNLHDMRLSLLKKMPQREAENNILSLIGGNSSTTLWTYDLEALPQPWSKDFGDACLQLLRNFVSSLNDQANFIDQWYKTLTMAATAIPLVCLASALQPWDIPEKGRNSQYWKSLIKNFTDVIKLRKRVQEEIS